MATREYKNWAWWWGRPWRGARELMVAIGRYDPPPGEGYFKFRHYIRITFDWPVKFTRSPGI